MTKDAAFTDTPEPKIIRFEVGKRIFNHGDMANPSHFGTIWEIRVDHYGTYYKIVPDGGSRAPYWIGHAYFDKEYKGHGGTRLVTKEAYDTWRDNKLAHLEGI